MSTFTIKNLDELSTLIISNAKQALASSIKETIKERVRAGVGVGDLPLPPYTPSTKRTRERVGRQSGFRDLYLSGKMLDDLEVRETKEGLEVYFKTAESAAKAFHTNLATPWLTLTTQDIERVRVQLVEQANNLAEKK
jgi:hypothetical protein